jgi:uncharacterized RDD family membrane protein YckC
MDERLIRAGFLRRLGAVVIDAIVAFVLAVAFFLVWDDPGVSWHARDAGRGRCCARRGPAGDTEFIVEAWLAYVVASWTPLLGRRSVGMRQLGTWVVREVPAPRAKQNGRRILHPAAVVRNE